MTTKKSWKPGKAGLTAALMAYQATKMVLPREWKEDEKVNHQTALDIAARVYLMYSKTLVPGAMQAEANLKWARTEILRHGIIAGIIKLELEVRHG